MHVQPDVPIMEKRYENAQKILQGFLTKKAAINTNVAPTWIGETDIFWYIRDTKEGKEFRLVDAAEASNSLAFDHQQLAMALSGVVGEPVDGKNLPFSSVEIDVKAKIVRFLAFDKQWQFEAEKGTCNEVKSSHRVGEIVSPDGRFSVFFKKSNLWLRDLVNGDEKPLTIDGDEKYVYGGPGTAWGSSMGCGLQVLWSPDSKNIFTVQRDTREVNALPVMQHVPSDGSIRPQVTYHTFAYPCEEGIETLRLLAIDITTGKHQPADYPQIPVTRNSWGFFTGNFGWWNKNGQFAYFVDVDRYYKYARLVKFDTRTGLTTVLFQEKSNTQINLMNNGDMHPSFVPLPETDEILWYSERSGWAHLYLYDLNTGDLKNAVTKGDWLVRDVVTVEQQRREVFIQTGCRTTDRNPYYRDLVRVNIDTGEMFTLASSNHDFFAGAFTDMMGIGLGQFRREIEKRGTSPTGNYSVVTRSRIDTLPESLIVNHEGEEVMLLEIADMSGMPSDWLPPEPVKVLSADKKTDIYGVIYRPSNFSPDKVYPVISDVLNTPDFPYAPIGAFDNNIFNGMAFYTAAAMAELGFIVIQLDGRGSSYRDKAFKDIGYGNLQLPCMLADQVVGIEQLAERYPSIDLTRIGINESTGGPGVLHGMLDYPDFYKVGVTNMPHDSRLMSASMWGDMFESKISNQKQVFPEEKVDNLQGKILLLGGMLDRTCPPATTFRFVEALHKANKNFDMILLPNLGHDFSSYLIRRVWDYLVENLAGEEPPKEFLLSGLLEI